MSCLRVRGSAGFAGLGGTRRSPHERLPLTALLVALCGLMFLATCAQTDDDARREGWPLLLGLDHLSPIAVLPSSRLTIHGAGFVGSTLGTTRLRLKGTYTPDHDGPEAVDVGLLVAVQSPELLLVDLGQGGAWGRICLRGQGVFTGTAQVEVSSLATNRVYTTPIISAGLLCRERLEPGLVSLEGGSHTLNASLGIEADDLLLGGAEGQSYLAVSGCFLAQGLSGPCSDNGVAFPERRIPLVIQDEQTRRDARFLLTPALVGLVPGTIEARAHLLNLHGDGIESASGSLSSVVTVLPSRLDGVDPDGSSLGGFVDFLGAGFVGGGDDDVTEVFVDGSFQPDGGGAARALNLLLVTTFDSGGRVRYVLEEQAGIGQIVDLREESGTLSGVFTPRFVVGLDSVMGASVTSSFRVRRIKQVVYVRFMPGYTDSLELFGMLAADGFVRQRIMEKAAWIYRGINVDFRSSPPDDYLLYSQVDITGIDPNGLGLMGYDNTPGKDVGNLRLYDRLGGVNALTQEDGYPGYGGVFVESFLSFSMNPPPGLNRAPTASPLFDEIFDPLRPDRGGVPISPEELAGLVPRSNGEGCPVPAKDRQEAVRCAIFVLGTLLGGTMAHEIGHSLGLADPGGNLFHNPGDAPNRLMDSGAERPFHERVELEGGGPEIFCQQDYDYLVSILPTGEPDPVGYRMSCF